MIKELIKLANHLDAKGLSKEADYLDAVIRKIAEGPGPIEDNIPGTGNSGTDISSLLTDKGITGQAKITWDKDPSCTDCSTESACADIGPNLNEFWWKTYNRAQSDLMRNPKVVHCITGDVLVTVPSSYYPEKAETKARVAQ